jgi:hypothetical protein
VIALLLVLLQQGPSIDADAGFFGDAYYDAWSRLAAVVANPGEEVEGELRVLIRSRNADTVVYRRAVTLPARVRKRFAWDAYFTGWETEAAFELVGKGGKALARAAVPIRFPTEERERQILQVGTGLSSLTVLQSSIGAAFVQTSPDRFPETLPPLLALDAIVFPEPQPLEPAQEDALVRWVELGGRLVFGPGRGAGLQNRFWRELCPLERPETRVVRAGEEETPVPLASGRLRAGAAFLSLEGRPAAFRAARGRGEIVFLGFPPDQEGIGEFFTPSALWRAVLAVESKKEEAVLDPRRGERRLSFESNSRFMAALADQEVPLHLGMLLLGGAVLLAYVVWIGPVHYFRLKRRGRLRRGALAFASVAGVFLAFSVAWATVFAARDVRLGHLVLADEGLVQTFSVLRAGESRVYELEGSGAFSPLERLRSFGMAEEGREARVDERQRAEVPLPALATRGFAGVRAPSAGEIGVSCRFDRDANSLEVVNDGPLRLRNCRLVTQAGLRPLGDVDARSRRTIPLKEHPSIGFPEWLRELRGIESNAWWWLGPSYFWTETPAREHAFLVAFYEQIQRSTEERRDFLFRFRQRHLDWSPRLDRGEAVFTGSFDADASGLRLGQGADVRTYGLVRVVVGRGAP